MQQAKREGEWFVVGALGGSIVLIYTAPAVITYGTVAISAEVEMLSLYGTGAFRTAMATPFGQAMVKTYLDAGAQFATTGKVNAQNAMVSGMSPNAIAPITGEISDISQNLIRGEDVSLTNSALKIGTGYIGNGLGGAAKSVGQENGMTQFETFIFENGIQSYHNNLQSGMIDHINK